MKIMPRGDFGPPPKKRLDIGDICHEAAWDKLVEILDIKIKPKSLGQRIGDRVMVLVKDLDGEKSWLVPLAYLEKLPPLEALAEQAE